MKDKKPFAIALEGPEPRLMQWPEPAKSTPEAERKTFPGEGIIIRED